MDRIWGGPAATPGLLRCRGATEGGIRWVDESPCRFAGEPPRRCRRRLQIRPYLPTRRTTSSRPDGTPCREPCSRHTRAMFESSAFPGIYRLLTGLRGRKAVSPPRSCVLSATRVSEPDVRRRRRSELLFIPGAASVFSPSTGDGACPRGPSVVTGPGQGLIRFLLKTGGTT